MITDGITYCDDCGTIEDVKTTMCPYAYDVINEQVPIDLCSFCYDERCDDI